VSDFCCILAGSARGETGGKHLLAAAIAADFPVCVTGTPPLREIPTAEITCGDARIVGRREPTYTGNADVGQNSRCRRRRPELAEGVDGLDAQLRPHDGKEPQ
jgi:hypothetical protein